MRGHFITLEGPEGAGKSTQVPLLKAWLEQQGFHVVSTRNPGGTPIGAQLRQVLLDAANTAMVPMAELMLYAADRAQHVQTVVEPALAAGSVVLCDRFGDSTLAYQGYGRGLDHTVICSLNDMATGGLGPDLTLLLDLPVEDGLARVALSRATDRLEMEALAFHQRLRTGYLEIARDDPHRCVVIDATQSASVVQQQLRAAVGRLLGERPVSG